MRATKDNLSLLHLIGQAGGKLAVPLAAISRRRRLLRVPQSERIDKRSSRREWREGEIKVATVDVVVDLAGRAAEVQRRL